MNYLLDTDTCIYWLNGRTTVRDRVITTNWNNLSICVITVAELYFGAYNSSQVVNNVARAEQFISNITILSLTIETLKQYGQLKAQLRQIGKPVADFDLLIASVALTENCILVTNNTRHYDRISRLTLENWTIS
ncbi:PIN domain nuclease [Aphanothece hegewaldii CCALA 016]|uniref:PIN domain nuclease n=1 Tax=Aphanothece hegewaldii CCALA 016 TaxID=2107694 RepID=A0A2T1M3Y2_9CHRO|nr:type II toxin-antitoxin system VapC family toxin [Aphanothece hegewaldii]PSF39528.1 PIN domain nuclease [Aphanothece hegewaldii CCALA 016]